MKKISLLFLLLVALISACKKDECQEKPLPQTGTVELNDSTKQINYSYCGDQIGNSAYFSIGGYSESGDFSCYAYFKNTNSPATGSYDLVPDTSTQNSGEATVLIYQISESDGVLNYRSAAGALDVKEETGNLSITFSEVTFEELNGKTEDFLGAGNILCD